MPVKVYERPLSHSSMSLYLECPQKFKFRYIDKLPEAPKWFFSFGQSVHKALEFFYSIPALPAPTLPQLLEHYKTHWKREGYKSPEQEREHLVEGERILSEYYRKHIDAYRLPLFAEYKFDLEVDGIPVTGFVDRIDRLDNGKLHVIDYKTGKAIAKGRLGEDRQLTMYQMAVEQLLGAQVESLTFYHLPTQTPLTIGPRPGNQIDALKDIVVDVYGKIQSRRFDPAPEEKKCQWCDYRPHCPVFARMYAAPPAPFAAAPKDGGALPALPGASDQDKLAELVDRYGELLAKAEQLGAEAQAVGGEIAALLSKHGYVRAFGSRFEVGSKPEVKWEFRDRPKLLEALKRHGLYDRVLKPSAPEVCRLLESEDVPPAAREELEALAARKESPSLSVKRLGE
ncbi:MAG: PD-(D/E)XK nuclease family protein [Elusimicrobia bacterium]|nr:PD-(D/E)XK nuclease family protein [Elusimicrobiota bacterium]